MNSKWIKDLDLRPKTINVEENIGQNLHDIRFVNDFLDITLKTKTKKKRKNREAGLLCIKG